MTETETTVTVEGLGDIKLVNVTEFSCPCGLKAWEGKWIERDGYVRVFTKNHAAMSSSAWTLRSSWTTASSTWAAETDEVRAPDRSSD